MLVLGVMGQRSVSHAVPDYSNFEHVSDVLDKYGYDVDLLIAGGANGPESLAERWAALRGKSFRKIPPNIAEEIEAIPEDQREDTHKRQDAHRRAFLRRNSEILAASHIMLVFWNGIVPATSQFIAEAMRANKRVIVEPMIS